MSEQLVLQTLPLPGLKLITRQLISDKRGSLQRMYCKEILTRGGISESIEQINMTLTHEIGVVRGLHFQYPPHAEIKIVSCVRGSIFDVAVDLRKDSPTFLQWHAEILSAELNNSLIIPKGFAHGYQTLERDCELVYFHTASYTQQAEGGLCPIDPILGISWPLIISDMSERDKNHPYLTAIFKGLTNEL